MLTSPSVYQSISQTAVNDIRLKKMVIIKHALLRLCLVLEEEDDSAFWALAEIPLLESPAPELGPSVVLVLA
jgi:hypothetical protein